MLILLAIALSHIYCLLLLNIIIIIICIIMLLGAPVMNQGPLV